MKAIDRVAVAQWESGVSGSLVRARASARYTNVSSTSIVLTHQQPGTCQMPSPARCDMCVVTTITYNPHSMEKTATHRFFI